MRHSLNINDRRIVVQLNGGLGNQMFQYAAARALSLRLEAELVLDTWSGFVRDSIYQRSYELDKFSIKARKANVWERFPFWVDRYLLRFPNTVYGKILTSLVLSQRYFLNENQLRFLCKLVEVDFPLPLWFTGYWQSPRYFDNVTELIVSELSPPVPTDPYFLKLGAEMRDRTSVAVGIRLYEESPDPRAQSNNNTVKSPAEVNIALRSMATRVPDARFYVFCTHRADFLNALALPADTKFVTAADGYKNSIDTLWLFSQCNHHILTNSSFYWWGAWLSENVGQGNKKFIFAADNFSNIDTLPNNWLTF